MRELLWLSARVLWLFAPLLVSLALAAVVHRWDLVRALKRPIDGGRTFRGKRLFGASKTWRGVAIAVVGSTIAVALQKHVLVAPSLSLLDYPSVSPIALGVTMGVAAMAGELPNSFVKRQLGIAPGTTAGSPALRALFWTWDQIDVLTASWPALVPWIRPTLAMVVASVVITLVVHPLVALLGYLLGARKSAR